MADETPKSHEPAYWNLVRGVSWAFAQRWSLRGVGLVSTMIMARLLTPADFGIVAMATMARGLLESVAELGVGMFIIREKAFTKELGNVGWTMRILEGMFVGAVLAVLAPLAAAYFDETRVIPVLYVFALASVCGGFTNIGMVLVRKELDFAKDFRFSLYERLTSFVATIGLAILLRSYWAIVLGHFAGVLAGVTISYFMHPFRPRFALRGAARFLKFAGSIVPYTLGRFLNSKGDAIVVGGMAGATTLGAYNVALELSSMVTQELVVTAGRGLFPNYASLADDRRKLAEVFATSVGVAWILCCSLGLGLYAVAREFVAVVLGSQWTNSVPLIEWLALYGVLASLSHLLGGQVLIVVGRERASALLTWIRLSVLLGCATAASRTGDVELVAASTVLAELLVVPTTVYVVLRSLPISTRAFLSTIWRPVLSGALMIYVVRSSPNWFDDDLLTLLTKTILGAATFVPALLAMWWLSGRRAGPESILIGGLRVFLRRLPKLKRY